MSGLIYAITCGSSVKIGWSINPRGRIGIVQTFVPGKLTLVGVKPGTTEDEDALHKEFSEWHIRGEWYKNKGKVAEFVSTLFPPPEESNTLHIMVGESMYGWLNEEWHRRKLASRADTIRAILEEAMRREG